MKRKSVYVIGAGPAGLAAARELAGEDRFELFVLESDDKVGGISRTETYRGYYFDIGGHRFFTKNREIDGIWRNALGSDFLTVQRKSKIYYNRRFFHYPLRFWDTFRKLGPCESFLVCTSYVRAILFPSRTEETFEDWTINRFGRRLYQLFFKSYTEKVWGVSCREIRSDWAAQRIKGLSFISAAMHAIFRNNKAKSLIDEFFYPRLGPGMMWERFREEIGAAGGSVAMGCRVVALHHSQGAIGEITYQNGEELVRVPCDQVISSMPLDNLIAALDPPPPPRVAAAARKISYRAFIIVVLIIERRDLFPDQWLYIHAPEVLVGRIQNFKNWSPSMVPDGRMTSLGMEYFCSEGDEIWNSPDEDLIGRAVREIELLGIAGAHEVRDSTVIRQPKAYPVYDEHYREHLAELKTYLGWFTNLQTVGRNGMHRYNNMDHSMLTGIKAAGNLRGENHDIWETHDADGYLEEDRGDSVRRRLPGPLAVIQRRPVLSAAALILLVLCLW